ncbi:hypothetical protein [Legionella waltersii]|uniref:Ninein n=1 Tax=Legionella waltersii TaxID=66969 RepID=A0A0W1ANQ0_9GAMM|nr:hypothetical protein [Legionella waltersii]KTD82969.1 ninein [Legionella waltersii]SNU97258.1 ninein [Legionella waltersii]
MPSSLNPLTPLFPEKGPITIEQGNTGDCYLLASLDIILNEDPNTRNIDKICKFKGIASDVSLFVSIDWGTEGGRHALRLKKIQPDGKGDFNFVLVNPWNNQKEDVFSKENVLKSHPKFAYYYANGQEQTLNVALLKSKSNVLDSFIANPYLYPMLKNLELNGVSFDVNTLKSISYYSKKPYFKSIINSLGTTELAKFIKALGQETKRNQKCLFQLLLTHVPNYKVLCVIYENCEHPPAFDLSLVINYLSKLPQEEQSKIKNECNQTQFAQLVIEKTIVQYAIKNKLSPSAAKKFIHLGVLGYLCGKEIAQLTRVGSLRGLITENYISNEVLLQLESELQIETVTGGFLNVSSQLIKTVSDYFLGHLPDRLFNFLYKEVSKIAPSLAEQIAFSYFRINKVLWDQIFEIVFESSDEDFKQWFVLISLNYTGQKELAQQLSELQSMLAAPTPLDYQSLIKMKSKIDIGIQNAPKLNEYLTLELTNLALKLEKQYSDAVNTVLLNLVEQTFAQCSYLISGFSSDYSDSYTEAAVKESERSKLVQLSEVKSILTREEFISGVGALGKQVEYEGLARLVSRLETEVKAGALKQLETLSRGNRVLEQIRTKISQLKSNLNNLVVTAQTPTELSGLKKELDDLLYANSSLQNALITLGMTEIPKNISSEVDAFKMSMEQLETRYAISFKHNSELIQQLIHNISDMYVSFDTLDSIEEIDSLSALYLKQLDRFRSSDAVQLINQFFKKDTIPEIGEAIELKKVRVIKEAESKKATCRVANSFETLLDKFKIEQRIAYLSSLVVSRVKDNETPGHQQALSKLSHDLVIAQIKLTNPQDKRPFKIKFMDFFKRCEYAGKMAAPFLNGEREIQSAVFYLFSAISKLEGFINPPTAKDRPFFNKEQEPINLSDLFESEKENRATSIATA